MYGDDGASAVEYGLIVFAIAATIAASVFVFGGVVLEMFTGTCEDIVTGIESSASCG